MTVQQLLRILELAVHDGYDQAEILFDTEGRTFDYHMAKVGSAYLETEFDPNRPFISLHEETK